MKNLVNRFPNVKGLKTRKGAEARIQKAFEKLSRVLTIPKEKEALEMTTYVIVEKEDGTFLPVVFKPESNPIPPMYFIDFNLCVTNY